MSVTLLIAAPLTPVVERLKELESTPVTGSENLTEYCSAVPAICVEAPTSARLTVGAIVSTCRVPAGFVAAPVRMAAPAAF